MNGILARLNAVFAFGMWVCTAMTFLTFLVTVGIDMTRPHDLAIHDAKVTLTRDPHGPNAKQDLASFTFDLEVDTTPLFHWNNKQLFMYLLAEYETPQNDINQVIVWDKIIMRGEKSNLRIMNKPLKYKFFDDGAGGLKENSDIKLTLYYNTVPNAGLLRVVKAIGGTSFALGDYASK